MSDNYNSGNKKYLENKDILVISSKRNESKHSPETKASYRNKEIKSTKRMHKINARNVKMEQRQPSYQTISLFMLGIN